MARKKVKRKLPYLKPKITKINLKTKEAILGFCKTDNTILQPEGTAPCIIAACFATSGS